MTGHQMSALWGFSDEAGFELDVHEETTKLQIHPNKRGSISIESETKKKCTGSWGSKAEKMKKIREKGYKTELN